MTRHQATTYLDLVLRPPPVTLPGGGRTRGPVRHGLTALSHLAGIADDAEVPVVVLVDRHHHEVLLEDVDLPGPALHLVVSPRQWLLPSLYRRGCLDQTTEPVGGEDVNPEQEEG